MINTTTIQFIIYLITLVAMSRYAYTDAYFGNKIYNRELIPWAVIGLIYFIFRFFTETWWVLLINPIFVWVVMAMFLFGKKGTLGGADVKILLIISLILPVLEFYYWMLGCCIIALVMHFYISATKNIRFKDVKSPFAVSMWGAWLIYVILFMQVVFNFRIV